MLRLTQWLFTYADPDLAGPADLTDPAEIIKTWNIVYRSSRSTTNRSSATAAPARATTSASLIANGKVNGCPMEERAMISYYVIASTAGHDTTSATTATSMWVLAEQPQLLARLKAEPKLIQGFVEESIRWATPVQQFVRSAAEDYELRGQKIRRATSCTSRTCRATATRKCSRIPSGSGPSARRTVTSPSATAATCASASTWRASRCGPSGRS